MLMSGTTRLTQLHLLTLLSVIAIWSAFAWVNKPPKPLPSIAIEDETPIAVDVVSLEQYGPFLEEKNKSVRPLGRQEASPSLIQNFEAIYLSDFQNEQDALDAWEGHKETLPVLHLFKPFSVPKTGSNQENIISLMAMLQQPDISNGAAYDIVLDTCDNLKSQGQDCVPVVFSMNTQGLDTILEATPFFGNQPPSVINDMVNDEVMRKHLEYRKRVTTPIGDLDITDDYNDIKPVSEYSLVDGAEEIAKNDGSDDTVVQAAMRAAYDMVHNRYSNAIYHAQMNDGDASLLSTQGAISLSQGALTSAAERAFERFIQDNFGGLNLSDQNYDGLRGYFMTAFQHAATRSIKSVGRRFVNDVTSGGGFKSLEIRSELLKGLDADIVSTFIDTGLAAARNSEYAFLRNLEVSYKIREDNKPEYSLLTLQPLYSSEGRKHNLFAQAAYSHSGERHNMTGGVGYRYMPESKDYVVGNNVFIDYEQNYGHLRASFGFDYQRSLWGASTNYYKGLTDWRDAQTGFQERSMDGYDLELSGRMPFLPALEVFGRGYRWQGIDGNDDIDGHELRVEYTPIPAFTVEGLYNDENARETQFGLGLRYNHTFGAPKEYLLDWQEQFRQKSVSEYIFRKAHRENSIRVQTRIDPDTVNSIVLGPGLASSSPINGATSVSIGTGLILTFVADVLAGVGNIVFTDLTDNSDDFTIPVGDARVSIVNNVVTVDLSAQLLDFNSNYEVTFAAGVFTDTSSNNSPEFAAGDLNFTTVVDPIAGFPVATTILAPNTIGITFTPANTTATWQTTIDVGASPDGLVFESGGTGIGIAASFNGAGLTFAAGDGTVTATSGDTLFGTVPLASIPQGLHHFVFVAKPTAAGEIGVYMDGIRVVTGVLGGAMDSGLWSGGDVSGYGLVNNSVRAGMDISAVSGLTLTNNLSFYSGQQPASF